MWTCISSNIHQSWVYVIQLEHGCIHFYFFLNLSITWLNCSMSFYFFYDKYIVSLKFSFKGVTLHSYSQYRKSILLLHPKNISWLKKRVNLFYTLKLSGCPIFLYDLWHLHDWLCYKKKTKTWNILQVYISCSHCNLLLSSSFLTSNCGISDYTNCTAFKHCDWNVHEPLRKQTPRLIVLILNAPSRLTFTMLATTHSTSISQVHALPVSSLSHALPGNIHTCTWVPSVISVSHVISLCAVVLSAHHIVLTGKNHEYKLCFLHLFFISWSCWVSEIISYLALLSIQITSYSGFFCNLMIN